MAKIDEALWKLSGVLSKSFGATVAPQRVNATVARVDKDGTGWLEVDGNPDLVPIELGSGYDKGDVLSLDVSGPEPRVSENVTALPATMRAVNNLVSPVKQAAHTAKDIAEAVGQHFFADDNGVHVTEEAGRPDTEHNILINAMGVLLRHGKMWRMALTDTALRFYDGLGNDVDNSLAYFGLNGMTVHGGSMTYTTTSGDVELWDDDCQTMRMHSYNTTTQEIEVTYGTKDSPVSVVANQYLTWYNNSGGSPRLLSVECWDAATDTTTQWQNGVDYRPRGSSYLKLWDDGRRYSVTTLAVVPMAAHQNVVITIKVQVTVPVYEHRLGMEVVSNLVVTPDKVQVKRNGKVLVEFDDSGNVSASGRVIGENQTLLWSGAWHMIDTQTATLSESVSDQPNGIVLVWCAYSSGAAQDWDWHVDYVPKSWVAAHPNRGITCIMAAASFARIGSKYVYVSDTAITGNANNNQSGSNNGITYNNAQWVLKEVWGV